MNTYDDTAHDHARDSRLPGTLWGLVALGALVGWGLNAVNRVRLRRAQDRDAPLSERLQTWEGEGGRPAAEARAAPGADVTASDLKP